MQILSIKKTSLTQKQTDLLEQTLNLAHAYRRLEDEICEALREIDRAKLYKKIGHRSLFQYATDQLGFSAAVAYSFILVARKSATVPELKAAIKSKHLSVAKASRIISCMTPENAASLIQFAQTHSCRETEREVARLNPKAARPDRVKPLAQDLNEIQGTISDQVNEKLNRAQSIMAQKGKATDLNSVLEAALDEYLKHHDPVEKAVRAIARKETSKESELLRTRKAPFEASTNGAAPKQLSSLRPAPPSAFAAAPKRVPLTAEQKHYVFHRDQGRCTHSDEMGKRCGSDRWVDVHHIVQVSRGGTNEPSNLTLLCNFHHDQVHQLSLAIEGQFNWLREPRIDYL